MNHKQIVEIWNALPSKDRFWGNIEWSSYCEARPELVLVGSYETGEIFEVINTRERRVMHGNELTNQELHEATWIETEGCPPEPKPKNKAAARGTR